MIEHATVEPSPLVRPSGHTRRGARVVGALALLLALTGPGYAQVCGDANGDGQITDVDGVNGLRAAAELSTLCTLATCDVDGNGVLTDTDGVLILRMAAGLSGGNCTPSGAVDPRVALLVQRVAPFLEHAFDLLPQIASPSVTTVVPCDNTDEDGAIEVDVEDGETFITYDECRLGETIFNGAVEDTEDGLFLDLGTIHGPSEDNIDYFNDDRLTATDTGGSLRLTGLLDSFTFFEVSTLENAGDFTLALMALEVAGDGNLVGGSVVLDLSQTGLAGLTTITIAYDGSNVARVTVGAQTHLLDRTQNRFL